MIEVNDSNIESEEDKKPTSLKKCTDDVSALSSFVLPAGLGDTSNDSIENKKKSFLEVLIEQKQSEDNK